MTPKRSPSTIHLRPLTRDDLALLSTWLRDPRVARWWAEDPGADAVEARYGPSIDGHDPAEVLIGSVDTDDSPRRPIGLAQRFRFADEPEYRAEVSSVALVPEGALSIDYLVGEADLQGQGLGPALISAVVADSWPRYPDADDIIVPVAVGNRASWRALEKAGFRRIARGSLTPDNPIDPPDHFVYRAGRPPTGTSTPLVDM